MLELLSGKFGVPRERLSIAGYADTAPVASNETEEGPRAEPARGYRDPERTGRDRGAGEVTKQETSARMSMRHAWRRAPHCHPAPLGWERSSTAYCFHNLATVCVPWPRV